MEDFIAFIESLPSDLCILCGGRRLRMAAGGSGMEECGHCEGTGRELSQTQIEKLRRFLAGGDLEHMKEKENDEK